MAVPPDEATLRRRLGWLTIGPLSVMGGLAGAVVVGWVVLVFNGPNDAFRGTPPTAWQLVWSALTTGTLTAVALGFALRAPQSRTISTLMMSCMVFGWLNAPLCFWATAACQPQSVESIVVGTVLGGTVAATLGAFASIPLGLVYAVVALFPLATSHGARKSPALDAPARVTRAVGAVMLPAGAVSAMIARAMPACTQVHILTAMLFAGGVAGGIASVIAHVYLHRHARWIARVREGLEPGWAIVPLARGTSYAALLRAATTRMPDASLLVRIVRLTKGGAYRSAPLHVRWATAPGLARDS